MSQCSQKRLNLGDLPKIKYNEEWLLVGNGKFDDELCNMYGKNIIKLTR